MLQNKIISTFSKKIARPRELIKFTENSVGMIDDINAMNPTLVLDLGCGTNIFKNRIKGLIGIDILNREEDIVCPIENLDTIFQPNCADVVLALGSINFGDEDLISKQLQQVQRVCKPGGLIYFRVNHNPSHSIYYKWTMDKIENYTKSMNFEYKVPPTFITKARENVYDDRPIDKQLNRSNKQRIFLVWRKHV